MKLVDSSGWIEFFTNGPLAGAYAAYLRNSQELVSPIIVLYEVYKKIKSQRSEEEALVAVSTMGATRFVPLTDTVALTAADVSLHYGLAMADAIIYATALVEGAQLITSDADLASLPGVMYLKKPG